MPLHSVIMNALLLADAKAAPVLAHAVKQVVSKEAEEAEQQRARERLAAFCLGLLDRLTLGWLPAQPGAAAGCDGSAGAPDAAEVARLLRLLRRLGVRSWRDLEERAAAATQVAAEWGTALQDFVCSPQLCSSRVAAQIDGAARVAWLPL
jgi:hypothetical protein